MKKKKNYEIPTIHVVHVETTAMLESSAESLPAHLPGCSSDDPAQLKRLLPLICSYNDLEPDIKVNLKKGDAVVYNFRVVEWFGGIPYDLLVTTSNFGDDRYLCDYTVLPRFGNTILIYYNIYDEILVLLRQIRLKENGVYTYKFSNEVKKKVPTLVKLFANLEKAKKAQYGIPYIEFIDDEKKYTILAVGIKADTINSCEDINKIHLALFKVFLKVLEECNKAGILDQSKVQLAKNLVRIGLAAHHISN